MPIINSLAFLFTVLGEYLAEGKGVETGMSTSFFISVNSGTVAVSSSITHMRAC